MVWLEIRVLQSQHQREAVKMAKTPLWFQEWQAQEFLHFKLKMEWRTKMALWLSAGILLAVVGELVRRVFWGG